MESLLKLLGVYIYSHNVHVISLVITATVHFDQHLDYIYIYILWKLTWLPLRRVIRYYKICIDLLSGLRTKQHHRENSDG